MVLKSLAKYDVLNATSRGARWEIGVWIIVQRVTGFFFDRKLSPWENISIVTYMRENVLFENILTL